MAKRIINFGIIGCGLMGKELASAVARWCHLTDIDVEPKLIAVCDSNPEMIKWFVNNIPSVSETYTEYKHFLENEKIEAVYCAVPHHLHEDIYIDIIESGKHLLAEKPFGIDLKANTRIVSAIEQNPSVFVRCSSEFPFFPGAYQISEWVREKKFGKIIEVEAGLWHSSDLDPNKPINWKRQITTNGEYGCLGDLGMHVLHLPLRFGWQPESVRAMLSNIMKERPNATGELVPCETWDNAILVCEASEGEQTFPLTLSMKRIAPGHSNTWFIRVIGTEFSAEFSTKNPKQLLSLSYTGSTQAWQALDTPNKSAYSTITGPIFEFGFSDSILQMWATFCDELVNGKQMKQPFFCVTPEEALLSHKVFTAALQSNRTGQTIPLDRED
jgi:predicted dehydrogenase